MPTSSSGGIGRLVVPFRISDSTPGAILQPQPPPCDSDVRRGSAAMEVGRGALIGNPAGRAPARGRGRIRPRGRTAAHGGRIVRAAAPAGPPEGLAPAG